VGNLQIGYGLDQNGYIMSDVALDKIDTTYFPCIRDSINKLTRLFPHLLHSVYVYGSVARGDAVAVKSDLDLLVIFKDTLNAEEVTELKNLAKTLSRTYISLIRDVGIAVINYTYLINSENYDEAAFLRELCVCLHGEDLRDRFGPYKLTSEIAISFNGDIHEVYARTMSKLEVASEEEFNILVQSFARKPIRTYYSMVMVRSQVWTTRLHEQSEVFIYFFPQKKPIIRTLQKWIEDPLIDRKEVLALFQQEGEWVSMNFQLEARITP
jgi:uncharacterized protein